MRRILFLTLGLIFFSSASHADTLILRNGQKITGKVTAQTEHSYRIEIDGVPYIFYSSEVARVEKGEAPKPQASTQPVVPSPQVKMPQPTKKSATSPEPISENLKQLILTLLEANGTRHYITTLFGQILAKVPPENREDVQDVLRIDYIEAQLIPIYAKYYTESDLKEIIAFYRSPVGVRHRHSTPRVMEEAMKEISKYFEQLGGIDSSAETNNFKNFQQESK